MSTENYKTSSRSATAVERSTTITMRVSGETLEALFTNALTDLARLLYERHATNGALKKSVPIKVCSIDVNGLLVDFLSEALYQSEVHQAVFHSSSFNSFSNAALDGEISGCRVPQFDRNITSVSYNNVRIVRNERGIWQTSITVTI